mmetsp:Transcript_37625/g.82574  ORF Transcript_37625/g.82574 Transcript_37625/m.82574 type:complete len:231 (+) Transcript_37625:1170-1862(+)
MSHQAGRVPHVHQGDVVPAVPYDTESRFALPGSLEERKEGVFSVAVWNPSTNHIGQHFPPATQRQGRCLDGPPLLEFRSGQAPRVICGSERHLQRARSSSHWSWHCSVALDLRARTGILLRGHRRGALNSGRGYLWYVLILTASACPHADGGDDHQNNGVGHLRNVQRPENQLKLLEVRIVEVIHDDVAESYFLEERTQLHALYDSGDQWRHQAVLGSLTSANDVRAELS